MCLVAHPFGFGDGERAFVDFAGAKHAVLTAGLPQQCLPYLPDRGAGAQSLSPAVAGRSSATAVELASYRRDENRARAASADYGQADSGDELCKDVVLSLR